MAAVNKRIFDSVLPYSRIEENRRFYVKTIQVEGAVTDLSKPGGCGSIPRPLKRMPHMKPEDLERLVTQTMPYGKYKGRLIADLPGNYLNWFARVGFPPGEIGQLLALMQEIDHNGLSPLLDPLRRR